MNLRSYSVAYPSIKTEDIQDLDDLVTAFAELYIDIDYQLQVNHFTKVIRNVDFSDYKTLAKHKTAHPHLIHIESKTNELIKLWPGEEDRLEMDKIFNKGQRGKKLPATELNELTTKLRNLKEIIKFLKEKYPLQIRRRYYYQEHKLFVSNLEPIPFRKNSDADMVLSLLFKNPFKKWRKLQLERRLIKKKPRPQTSNTPMLSGDPVKNSVDYINSQIRKYYNKHGIEKLISQDGGMIEVDTGLFHACDRINRTF